MGRPIETSAPALAPEQAEQRFRRIEITLRVATAGFAALESEYERMKVAAAATDDPAERLRLAVDCATSIRPRWLARMDVTPHVSVFPDFSHWRPT